MRRIKYLDFDGERGTPDASVLDFSGGENAHPRSRMAPNQVLTLRNMQIELDGVYKAPGYEAFADPSYAGDNLDRWLAHAQEDAKLAPTNLWVFFDGDAAAGGRLALVDSNGSVTDKASLPYGYGDWGTVILGGTDSSPEALLASCGNGNAFGANAGIADLSTGSVVQWNAADAFAANSFLHWDRRLLAVNTTDNLLYYTPRRTDWTTDADDWQYLPVQEPNVANRFLFSVGQNAFVMKNKGISRVEFTGGSVPLREVPVTSGHGCRYHRGWTYLSEDDGIAFFDDDQVKIFDGNRVRSITNEWNIKKALVDQTFDDVFMTFDEDDNVLTVGFYEAGTSYSWGWNFYLDYRVAGTETPPAVSFVWAHAFRYVRHHKLSGATDRYWGTVDATAGPEIYKDSTSYSHAGTDYVSYLELHPADLSMARTAKFANVREAILDMSADQALSIRLHHGPGDQTYDTTRTRIISAGDFQQKVFGVKRRGVKPQFKVGDNGFNGRWGLHSLRFKGVVRQVR